MQKPSPKNAQNGLYVNLPAKERLKMEVVESGLSFKEWYGKVYMRSDHWSALKKAKFAISGVACQQCSRTERIQVHHLAYKSIYDVTVTELLVVCGVCHDLIHEHEHTAPKCARNPTFPTEKKRAKVRANVRAKIVPTIHPQQMAADDMTKRQRKAHKKALKKQRRLEYEANEQASREQRRKDKQLNKHHKAKYKVVRDVVRPVQTDGRTAIVTKEMVMAIRTRAGAWTGRQYECFGLRFCPPKEWITEWKDRPIPLALWEEAESITRADANMPSVEELLVMR